MRTLYTLNFERDGTYQGQLKRTYENTWRHRLCNGTVEREFHSIPTDRLYTKGDFELRSDTLLLKPPFSATTNTYRISFADRDVLILIRVSE